MTDLSDFLRARLDEDEVEARKYSGEPWEHPGAPWEIIATTDADYPCLRIDKRRVLAEVDAKRRIIDEHPATTERTSWNSERTICDRCRYDDGLDAYDYPCLTLLLLALPYADHSDYRQEWKP